MTKETMNVHQALAELKTMESRITKAIREPDWVVANKHSNTKIGGVSVDEWKANAKAAQAKVMDLIRRRDAIKRAVVNSNAVTKVIVAGKEYTVAEAIDRKNNGVGFLTMLAQQMAKDHTMAKMNADRANGPELDRRADDHIKVMFGSSDMKGSTEEARKVRTEFIEAQTTELVDPIGVLKVIAELDEEVTSFLTAVDAALSVSNAVTQITVEY